MEDYEKQALIRFWRTTGKDYLTVEEIVQVQDDLNVGKALTVAVLSHCAKCPICISRPYRYVHFYDGRQNPNKFAWEEEEEKEEQELARAILGCKSYYSFISALHFFLNDK